MRRTLPLDVLYLVVAVSFGLLASPPARAQSTAFTYQGSLEDSGQPASGLHDFRFRLFDAATGGAPHDDHLHVRFYCTPEDMAGGCEDSAPTYFWRAQALRERDLSPVINHPRRDRPSAPTTSSEEARASAGPMHARVTEWLTMREAWERQPHPGRTFCR